MSSLPSHIISFQGKSYETDQVPDVHYPTYSVLSLRKYQQVVQSILPNSVPSLVYQEYSTYLKDQADKNLSSKEVKHLTQGKNINSSPIKHSHKKIAKVIKGYCMPYLETGRCARGQFCKFEHVSIMQFNSISLPNPQDRRVLEDVKRRLGIKL